MNISDIKLIWRHFSFKTITTVRIHTNTCSHQLKCQNESSMSKQSVNTWKSFVEFLTVYELYMWIWNEVHVYVYEIVFVLHLHCAVIRWPWWLLNNHQTALKHCEITATYKKKDRDKTKILTERTNQCEKSNRTNETAGTN